MRIQPTSMAVFLLLAELTSVTTGFTILSNSKNSIHQNIQQNTHYNTRTSSVPFSNSVRVSTTKVAISTASQDGIDMGSSTSSTPPDMEAYAAGYTTVFTELPCSVVESSPSSTLPSDLVGTYFRSGPAMFSAGSIIPPKTSIVQPKQPPVPDNADPSRMVQHPFDGDGAVLALTFPGDGNLTARFRYVRTAGFTSERKKGMKLYTGMESTRDMGCDLASGQGNDVPAPLFKHHLKPGLNKKRKNTSNTRSIYWSKKLLTLWEGGLPYKLDALALSTEGKSQLGGILLETTAFSGSNAYDSTNERMLFYALDQQSSSSKLTLYEFNAKFRLAKESEYKLPGFALLSDIAVTEKKALLVQPPVSVSNGMQFMVSKDPGKSLNLEDNSPALLHVISRADETLQTIEIPTDGISDADLQFCNAYEQDGGKTIIIDAIRSDGRKTQKNNKMKSWPWFSTLRDYQNVSSKKSLWRYRADLTTGQVTKECITLMQTSFGTINPSYSSKEHQYIYTAVGALGEEVAPAQGIAKFNIGSKTSQVWYPKEYEFCGEPMYAPRKGGEDESSSSSDEDNGYIISILFNGQSKESEAIVLDAKKIENGPIARVPLGIGVPHGLHGCFAATEEANWNAEEIDRRAKLADKMESRGNMWNEVKSDFSGLGLRLDDFEEYFGDML